MAIGTPQSVPVLHFSERYPAECTVTRPTINIFFMAHREHFFLSNCAQLLFSTLPHQLRVFTFIERVLYPI